MKKVGVIFVLKTKIKTDKVRSDWRVSQSITKFCTSVRYIAYLALPDGQFKEHYHTKLEYTQESGKLLLKEVKELIKATRTRHDVPIFDSYGRKQISLLKGYKDAV